MKVRILAPAQDELEQAMAWYEAKVPALGDSFLVEISRVLKLIQQLPQAWHPLSVNTRRCRLNRFPYAVIYSETNGELVIIAIAHLHRNPMYWRKRFGSR